MAQPKGIPPSPVNKDKCIDICTIQSDFACPTANPAKKLANTTYQRSACQNFIERLTRDLMSSFDKATAARFASGAPMYNPIVCTNIGVKLAEFISCDDKPPIRLPSQHQYPVPVVRIERKPSVPRPISPEPSLPMPMLILFPATPEVIDHLKKTQEELEYERLKQGT